MRNAISDYCLEKNPIVAFEHELPEWSTQNDHFIHHDNYVDDQPNFSHNEIYALAKKMGFPTEFEL